MRAPPDWPRHHAARRFLGRSLLRGHGRSLQPAGSGPGRERLRVSERRSRSRRPAAARAGAHRARRSDLPQPRADHPRVSLRHGPRWRCASPTSTRRRSRSGQTSVPLDGKSNLLLRYRGPKRTFPYVSAVDVLRGNGPRRDLQGQDRPRRHDGARHARSGVDAARYALRRCRSPGDGRRQSASARLHQALGVRGCLGNATRHRPWTRIRARRAPIRPGVGRGRRGLLPGDGVVRRDSPDGDERRLPVAALSDDRIAGSARVDDRRALHERASARRSRRPGQAHFAAPDGAVAAVADRGAGRRDGQALAPDAGLYTGPGAAARRRIRTFAIT